MPKRIQVATTARDVTDSMRMLRLAQRSEAPTVALAMGERGLPSRLLAPKFGAHLTFGSMSRGRESAAGQVSVQQLREVYRLPQQKAATKVFGIIGNPVAHSRSPVLHNACFAAAGIDAVYIPYLVDELGPFLDAFGEPEFAGFSITIPHKVAALKAAAEVDEVAAQIGAVNTLVRGPDGGLKGHNTDWSAAISAIESALAANPLPDCDPEGCSLDFGDDWDEAQPESQGSAPPPQQEASSSGEGSENKSPLEGLRVVILGAGGSARALAFGAQSRGADVVIANRNKQRAEALAAALGRGAEAAELAAVRDATVFGDVLVNTTSVGMSPGDDESPVPHSALAGFRLVFDAVYTPPQTRLLKDAAAAGCVCVGGLEMFVGQAARQFELFTGKSASEDLMHSIVLNSLKQ